MNNYTKDELLDHIKKDGEMGATHWLVKEKGLKMADAYKVVKSGKEESKSFGVHNEQSIINFSKDWGSFLMCKAELKHLPQKLDDSEKLLGLASGFLMGIGKKDNPLVGIIVVTDRRVFFYRRTILGTERMEEYPLSKIGSISIRKAMVQSSIIITVSNDVATIEKVDKNAANKIHNIVSSLINNQSIHQNPPIQASAAAENKDNLMQDLKNIKELFDTGILTESEYNEKKNLLIQKMGL